MTRFDAILRIVSREVDAKRSAVGVAAGRLAQCDAARAAALASLRAETRVAAADRTMATDAYFAAAAARREHLELDRTTASAQLDAVRRSAVAAYGSLRAVEAAADRLRAAEDLRLRTAEQSAIDDFIGARLARAPGRRPVRRAWGGMA